MSKFDFSTLLPSDAVFGVLYEKINTQFTAEVKNLPILQIPEAVRMKDQNLTYQPHYMLTKDNLNIRIGPKVIIFTNTQPYIGWDKFFYFISDILTLVATTNVITSPERIGLRYIDIFAEPTLLSKINASLTVNNSQILTETTSIRIERVDGNYIQVLQIGNNVNITAPSLNGNRSVIDIDCIYKFPEGSKDFFRGLQRYHCNLP